jgi:DNA-binding CsgD family transcriptional regulator
MTAHWPLTGRAEELRVIEETLADPEFTGVVVAGAAGVGKSRLARAAADAAAQQGWCVQHVAGTATGRQIVLGAFAPWAEDLDESPVALARNVVTSLTASTDGAPLLLLVDDAHLLDDLSALIVHQVVLQRTATVIATIRTGEPASDAVTALWKDGHLRRLELQPLSRDECVELLQRVLDGPVDSACAERMWRLSRGNTLFLRHLADHARGTGDLAHRDGQWRWDGDSPASPSLMELVDMQIGEVPDEVAEVVDLVAISEPIDRTVLTSLVGPDGVEGAEQRGLIETAPATDSVYVGHPLYGEIRLSRCGPLRLRRLRGRVAVALAQRDHVDPVRLGLLRLDSDLPPDADILGRAAHVCALRMDLTLAERLARAAVAAQPRSDLTLQLAHILHLQEKSEEAEEILDTLDTGEAEAPGYLDSVVLRAANLLMPLRSPQRSLEVLDEALGRGAGERSHALRTFRAVGLSMAARHAEVLDTMAAVDRDRLDGYGRVVGCAAETIALGDLGRLDEAQRRADEGYRVLDGAPLESFQASGLAEFHAYALLAAGCLEEATAVVERGYRRCADLPGVAQAMAVAAVGMVALARGDLREALGHLDAMNQSFGGHGEVSGLIYRFRILRTEALARSGDVDAAVASLATADGSRHPAYVYVGPNHLLAGAWVAAAQGDTTRACELARAAASTARENGQPAREVLCLQTATQFGDRGGGARLTELAGLVEGPRAPLAARYATALQADDAAALDAVAGEFARMGDRLAAADAAAQAAAAHRRAGRRGPALTSSAVALRLAADCGGAVSPALTGARVPLPFTRREQQVALLLARGMSNRLIAEALSLSIRTVEGHIYQSTLKAGVSSRTELSDLVRSLQEC